MKNVRLNIRISSKVKNPALVRECVFFAARFMAGKAAALGKKFPFVWVKVQSCYWSFSGRAEVGGGDVLLRFGNMVPGRHTYRDYKDMPVIWLNDPSEHIVFLAAHEFGHSIGFKGRREDEILCERFGERAVEAWRERNGIDSDTAKALAWQAHNRRQNRFQQDYQI